jgi:hypothetical protein
MRYALVVCLILLGCDKPRQEPIEKPRPEDPKPIEKPRKVEGIKVSLYNASIPRVGPDTLGITVSVEVIDPQLIYSYSGGGCSLTDDVGNSYELIYEDDQIQLVQGDRRALLTFRVYDRLPPAATRFRFSFQGFEFDFKRPERAR